MATAFTEDVSSTIKNTPNKIKNSVQTLLKSLPEPELIFADANWNKSASQIWQIKTSESNISYISKNTGNKVDNKGNLVVKLGNPIYTLKFIKSGKKSSGKTSSAADAKTTRMQELGSAWIIKRAIKDNIKYDSWKDIKKDKKYKELVEIYPDVDTDDEWLKGYYAQQERMLKEFSKAKFDEFNREGGFMDYITNLVSKEFSIQKKDTWNPADIWLVENEKNVIKVINESLKKSKSVSKNINELNAVLRTLFKQRKLVGISLKKISGKTAQYEEYNVDDVYLPDDFSYDISNMKIDLSYQGDSFGTQDARIIVIGKGAEYNFQIKGNDSSKLSNLKYEPTQKGASAARVGKAPVDMVSSLMEEYKISFKNDNKLFAQNLSDFKADSKRYIENFEKIKNEAETKINSTDQFVKNMEESFMSSKKHISTSKLMQLEFLSSLLNLNKKERDKFMTDMVFLSAKKGEKFGPFGKLF